jgi:NodT family efflux transporter outer membrane factor (OMF) lipoprotein
MALGSAWRGAVFNGTFHVPPKFDQNLRTRGLAPVARAHARYAISAVMAALVCGCAVGPDFGPPAPPDVAGYTAGRPPTRTAASDVSGGASQRFVKSRDIPGDWWRMFRSRPLRDLIERALKNNPDLAAAQAALRVAQANVAAGKGAYFPAIDGNFSATREKPPISGPLVPDENGNLVLPVEPTFNLFTGQVLVSYTPDVFGGIRRNVESLQALSDNQRFLLEATYLTLTSNIVLAAVQESSLRGQIDATQSLIKIATNVLDLLRTQFNAGQIAETDVATQQAALAQVEETLPPLQRQLAAQRHLLSALSGGLPSQEPPEKFTISALHLPRDLPLSVPSELVQQRPDLRAAEENLHSTSALIGVAVANRLPAVTLTANVGSTAPAIDLLFSPGTGAWAITGSVLQPIFHGGTLYQREVAARAAFEQASSLYRSTVVTAFQNVADSLSAIENDAVALQKAVAAENAANRVLAITRRRLELGEVNFLQVLVAQQFYLQALLTRVQAQANRFSDTVALFQSLGGGWWNRNDLDPPKHYPFINLAD